MTSSILLVGEGNPLSSDPQYALYNYPPNCSGHRLQKILGVDDDAYLGFHRANLCRERWSAPEARRMAAIMVAPGTPWRTVVALGRKVADAFERATGARLPPFHVHDVVGGTAEDTLTIVALPHPSGMNRIWNEPQAVFRARALLLEAAPHVPWGSVPP